MSDKTVTTQQHEGVSLVATNGSEEDPFASAFEYQSPVPLSVSRPRGRPDLVMLFTNEDDHAGGNEFSLHLTEAVARQLASDLAVVLGDPDHPGFIR